MRLSSCFTTIFTQILMENGFKKKGILYYRMNGDILQGITIKLINPYTVTFSYFPYWIYDFAEETKRYSLGKSYWAEINGVDGSYYRKENEDAELENMRKIGDLVQYKIIPFLDKIYDLESYIAATDNDDICSFASMPEAEKGSYGDFRKRIYHNQPLNQYAMLLKANRDGSFIQAEKIVNDRVRKIFRKASRIFDDITIKSIIDWDFPEFYGRFSDNDTDWIIPIYEKACTDMKQRLFDELKITVE